MPRGRLIFPFLVDIARLDTAATAADPDAGGPLLDGYDDEFREPVIVPLAPTQGSTRGTVHRVESTVQCAAQIEDDELEKLEMMATGRGTSADFTIVLHFRDLERRGLVDPVSGEALIRVNDRIDRIYTRRGVFVQAIRNPPGLFCVEAKPRSFGLDVTHSRRNLLVCTFNERETGADL